MRESHELPSRPGHGCGQRADDVGPGPRGGTTRTTWSPS